MGEPRNDAPDAIPLADEDFLCASCGKPFKPKGGESTCAQCHHVAPRRPTKVAARPVACARCGYDLRGGAGLRCPECGEATDDGGPKDTGGAQFPAEPVAPGLSRRVHGTVVPALVDRSRRRIGEVFVIALAIVGCAAVAFVVTFAHWASEVGGDWTIAVVWSIFATVALLAFLCTAAPENRNAWERNCGLVGFLAALATMFLLAGYPFLAGTGGLAVGAVHDLLTTSTGVLFIVATGRRLRLIAAWTGCDPHEEGFVAQTGPFLLSIFIVSSAYLLTHFYRRGLDAADAYALAICAWLVWRAGAIAWHTLEAVSSRAAIAARTERHRSQAPPSR